MRSCAICTSAATHYCAQDDAFLCAGCNVSIHSANVLASRHQVVSIQNGEPAEKNETMPEATGDSQASATPRPAVKEEPEGSPDSWTGTEGVVPVMDSMPLDLLDNEQTLDLGQAAWDFPKDMFDLDNAWMDKLDGFDFPDVFADEDAGLVPCISTDELLQTAQASPSTEPEMQLPHLEFSEQPAKKVKLCEEVEWDIGFVPTLDPQAFADALSDEQLQHRTSTGTPAFQMPAPTVKVSPQQAALNRAARIALHREKKKGRTFQKTIRYACRKAYAEVRPRIKGRFATKEEVLAYKAAQAQGDVGSIEEWAAVVL